MYEAEWKVTYKSVEIDMYGHVHSYLLNVSRLLLPGVQLQIKFTRSKSDFIAPSNKADFGAVFRFLDSTLHVRHVIPSLTLHLAQPKP